MQRSEFTLSDSSWGEYLLCSYHCRLFLLFGLMRRVHLLYQRRLWEADLSPTSSSRTRLLLWPSFPLSPPSLTDSPLLRGLVFASHTHSGYSHVTHRIYPLRTFAHTSAELTKISSTVNEGLEGVKGEAEELANLLQGGVETAPTFEYVCWTDMPLFLITYTPKVCSKALAWRWNFFCTTTHQDTNAKAQ